MTPNEKPRVKPNITFAKGENFEVSYLCKNPGDIDIAIYAPTKEKYEIFVDLVKDDSNFKKMVYETPFAVDTIIENLKFEQLHVFPEYYYLRLKR